MKKCEICKDYYKKQGKEPKCNECEIGHKPTPQEFDKVLREFLVDCVKKTERKKSGRGESDRHFMIKLLDREWYDISPRAEELLKAFDKLHELPQTNTNQETAKETIK
jgi:hypothetical protein